jgi:hypothetical protein
MPSCHGFPANLNGVAALRFQGMMPKKVKRFSDDIMLQLWP